MDPIDSLNAMDASIRGAGADRVAYFETLIEGFHRAAKAQRDAPDFYYRIGGEHVRLLFAGDALVPRLTRALAHLRAEPAAQPALTVCLWDSASTQTPLPLLGASLVELIRLRWWEQLDVRRAIKGYNDARIQTTFHLGPDILSALDLARSLAVYWVQDAEQIPYYEQGYPLQAILNGWMTAHGRAFIHAAAVGTREGGVLLAGKGGVGKSTTTLACLDSELQVVGDDYCLMECEPKPHAFSLYNTVKLKSEMDIQRFSHLARRFAYLRDQAEARPLIFLSEHFPSKMSDGFPINAVLVPQVTGETATRTCALSPAAALRALAPSTMFQLPGTGQSVMRLMAELVKHTRCYTLELGTDLAQIPGAISRVIAA